MNTIIRQGRLFLKLMERKIAVKDFLAEYNKLTGDEINEFIEVSPGQLGKFKEHEEAHGEVYKKRGIDYKYYLSKDKKTASTVSNEKKYYDFASKLSTDELITFLKEAFNPKGVEADELTGSDYLFFQIFDGKFTDRDIENYVLAKFTK